ncbi:MAG TPA: tRNA 2-thiocytidine(32) synthetase TtcA [Candidatus Onthoplasma faecigallinarum]|nr:tRNA 2-thiocytidine(32) synthetase TtcA [Candidatus Onthoplasma faecigallinarum]
MQKVLSTMRKAIEKYKLIQDGDKIAVGVSGGKDSLVLLKALNDFKKFGLYKFDIVAVTIDIYSGEVDYSNLKKFCDEIGVELYVEKTDIKHIVFDIRKESNPCSLCAKMRRGALNSVCNELGCNKLALAHHLQDVVTTFFMSLFYEGRLSTMLPISYMSKTNITLIRPLYLTDESKIIHASRNMPILKSKCPANNNSKRKEIKELVARLEKEIPLSKKRIEHAILCSESYNLLDKVK